MNFDNVASNYNRYLTLCQQQAVYKQQLDNAETTMKVGVSGLVANKTATIGQVVAAGP